MPLQSPRTVLFQITLTQLLTTFTKLVIAETRRRLPPLTHARLPNGQLDATMSVVYGVSTRLEQVVGGNMIQTWAVFWPRARRQT